MKNKTYKPKKIGLKWYFIIYLATNFLYKIGFESPWLFIISISIAVSIFMINRTRVKNFKKAIEECNENLSKINNLYTLSQYSVSALDVEDEGLKCMLAQLIKEKAKTTPLATISLNAPIAKGRACLFTGKMKKKVLLWDKAESVSVYVFNNALEWMSDTKHDTKSFQNVLQISINESGNLVSILLRGNNGMLHFKGNNAIVLANILARQ